VSAWAVAGRAMVAATDVMAISACIEVFTR
jgi:hypothetical protein